jgi:hypothetical protein
MLGRLFSAASKKLVGMKMDGWAEEGVGLTKGGKFAMITNGGRILYWLDESEARDLKLRVDELEAAMQEFVDRCDRGEVRSAKTYTKFRALLAQPKTEQKS